jgi:hypothetical protein
MRLEALEHLFFNVFDVGEPIKRLRSAIGARVSYCSSSSGDTSKAPASFAKISSEGNLLPSSVSERKAEEMPILFANPRKDKSALSLFPAAPSSIAF